MARALNKGARVGMWIGLIVGGIGGLIGVGAGVLAPLLTTSGPMKYLGVVISVPIVLILVTVFGVLYKLILKPLLDSDKLLDTGVQTPASLIKIWETNTYINNRPLLGMLVEVKPKFGPPYQVEVKSVISLLEIARLQPGVNLLVRVDPKDKNRVAVEKVGD